MQIYSLIFNLPNLKLHTYHIRMPTTNIFTTIVFHIAAAPLKMKIFREDGYRLNTTTWKLTVTT